MPVRFDEAEVGGETRRQTAGDPARGEFRCCACGHDVVVHDALPVCPVCDGATWERVPWRPFTRVNVEGEPREHEAVPESRF